MFALNLNVNNDNHLRIQTANKPQIL